MKFEQGKFYKIVEGKDWTIIEVFKVDEQSDLIYPRLCETTIRELSIIDVAGAPATGVILSSIKGEVELLPDYKFDINKYI